MYNAYRKLSFPDLLLLVASKCCDQAECTAPQSRLGYPYSRFWLNGRLALYGVDVYKTDVGSYPEIIHLDFHFY
jgi:hypothetical protein